MRAKPYPDDISGVVFGRLTALFPKDGEGRGSADRWHCQCSCGNTHDTTRRTLINGKLSCGCLQKETASKMAKTHGLSKTPENRIWKHIKERVANPRCAAFSNYGGRGIGISIEWENSFEAFIADMGSRPSPKHTIERINNNGNYCAENCIWALSKQQNYNKRNNVLVTIGYETLPLGMWCERYDIRRETVLSRVSSGASFEEALRKPVRKISKQKRRIFCVNGIEKTMSDLAREFSIPLATLHSRLDKNMSIYEALGLR